jgi:hypothetical protein
MLYYILIYILYNILYINYIIYYTYTHVYVRMYARSAMTILFTCEALAELMIAFKTIIRGLEGPNGCLGIPR